MKNLQFICQKKFISKLLIFLLIINSFMLTDALINQSYATPVISEMNINTTDNEVSVSGNGNGNGLNLAEKPFRYTIGTNQSEWVRDLSNMMITETLTSGALNNTQVINNNLELLASTGVSLNGYAYKSTLIIDHTKIDTSLTNFPLTVYLNSSNFDFNKAKADGTDIRFTDTNLNPLKFEREEHSAANGKAVYNVLVPSVSNTADTAIYMWYGNSNAYNTSIEAWQDQTGKQLSSDIIGQTEYTVPGTYSFVVPSGVTSICSVLVGGGGGGSYKKSSPVGAGGGGGGLRYINNLPVNPGETLTVIVGSGGGMPGAPFDVYKVDGANSVIKRGNDILVYAECGETAALYSSTGGLGGTGSPVGAGAFGGTIGGGNGGSGGSPTGGICGGGGGAGGYSGNGGNGGGNTNTGTAGTGGGGGGGIGKNDWGVGGGGVGLYGEGASGAASQTGGGGGSGGGSGKVASGNPSGGAYGGGSGGDENESAYTCMGAGGAVRIIYGNGRAFPSTLTTDTYRNAKILYSATYGRRVAYFDGSGGYFSLLNNITDLNFLHQVGTAGKWTAEFNYKANGFAQTYQTMFDTGRGTSANAGMWIKLLDNRSIEVGIAKGTSSTYVILGQSPAGTYPNDTANPHKIEVDYDQSLPSNNLKIFIDGALVYQAAKTANTPSLANCMIPYIGSAGDTGHCNGYLLGMRLTNGRCRNAADYSQNAIYEIDGSDVAFCTNFDTIYDQNYSMVQHLGDSLIDASGNGNSGTATGTTVINTEYGKARSFDGIDDYIISKGFSIGADPLFTVVANWQGLTNKSNVGLWGLGGGNTGNGIESFAGGAGNIGIDLWGSSTYEIASDYLAKNCTAWIKNNTGVFDNTKFKIFNNGILQQPVQTRYNGATPSLTNGISIGNASANYTGYYSNAVISEFRVSNIARSDAWIKAESLSMKNALVIYSAPITSLQYSPSGTRESGIYDISCGVSVSRIQWIENKPAGTNIVVESNVSLDGGSSWLGWELCANGGSIADLTSTNSSNARLKLRQTLSTSVGTITPSISNSVITINLSKYVHQVTATPNTEYTVKFEVKDASGSVMSETRKVYSKAQAPLFTVSGSTENSVDLLFSDANPPTTEYQIMCDSSYINSSGVMTSVPTWITLKNKKITILGLNIGTMYNFNIKARNAAEEETNYASPINITTQGIPVPTGSAILAATALNNSVTLGWNEIPNSLSYELEIDGAVKNVGLRTDYLHKDLMTNTQHTYRVRGRNLGGFSDWSELVIITTTNNLPLIPANVLAKASKDSVSVYWNPAQDALTYTVEIDGVQITDVSKNSACLFGLEPETTYTYKVKACNLTGESEWSETGSITTHFLSTPEISLTDTDSNEIRISWEKIEGATTYEIALDSNDNFDTLYASDLEEFATSAAITYIHENLPIMAAHVYRIRAICGDGNSAWSDSVTLETLPQRPSVPANFRGNASDNFITLIWDAVQDAIGYDLEVDGIVIENDNTPQYQYKGLDQYTEHTYRVRSVNGEIQSYWSDMLKIRTLGGVPEEPKNVIISNSRGITTLDWDKTPGALIYDIEIDNNSIYSISKDTFVYRNVGLITSSTAIYKETAYRIRAGNDLGKSDWSGYYVNNAIMGKVEKGKELDLGLTASNIMDFSRYTLYVNYNDKALTVTDLCAYSIEKELVPGMVDGHDIEIVRFEPGHIVFRVNKIVDEGYLWTGIINNIKFKGNATGGSTLTYTAQCSKD